MDLGQLGSFWGVTPIYAAALILYAIWFRGGEDAQGRRASTLLWFAVVLHAFGLAALGIGRGFWPPTNLGETLSLVALSTAVLYLYLELHGGERGLAPFALSVIVGILVGASLIGPSFLVSPILREPFFPPHASAIILAMAGFVIGAVLSLTCLLQYRQLRLKRHGLLMQRLPSLQGMDQMQRRATRVGWVFLTLAIAFGSLLWHEVKGTYWEWDPTQCMALLTWLLYGGALLLRRTRGWHGDRLARANLVVFAIVVVGMVLVNFVFETAHEFGGGVS